MNGDLVPVAFLWLMILCFVPIVAAGIAHRFF